MATYLREKATWEDKEVLDEIKNHQESRYLSVGDEDWDIFEFPGHENFPPFVQLDLHLPR